MQPETDCKNRTQTWSVPIISNRITQSSYVTPRATAANAPSDETSGAATPKGSGATSHFFASIVYASEDVKVICLPKIKKIYILKNENRKSQNTIPLAWYRKGVLLFVCRDASCA